MSLTATAKLKLKVLDYRNMLPENTCVVVNLKLVVSMKTQHGNVKGDRRVRIQFKSHQEFRTMWAVRYSYF